MLQSGAHPLLRFDPVYLFSEGKRVCTLTMPLLAAVTAGHEPLSECFLDSLSWHIVTVTVLIPQSFSFSPPACLVHMNAVLI